jgi:hypothetical protein
MGGVRPARHGSHGISPSAFIERLFAKCPVRDPRKLNTAKVMERRLHAKRFLVPMLDMLIAEGLLEEEDDKGVVHRIEFESYDELFKRADNIMMECADKEECNIDDVTDKTGQLDWMEGFSNRAEDGFIAWFAALTMYDLLRPPVTSRSPRRCPAHLRNGIFYGMVGTANGVQLAEAIRTFYYKALGQSVATSFLLKRLSDFLVDSEWPEVYRIQFDRWEEYAYDLPRRVACRTPREPDHGARSRATRRRRRDSIPTPHAGGGPALCEHERWSNASRGMRVLGSRAQ